MWGVCATAVQGTAAQPENGRGEQTHHQTIKIQEVH